MANVSKLCPPLVLVTRNINAQTHKLEREVYKKNQPTTRGVIRS